MRLQAVTPGETFLTNITLVRFLSGVYSAVISEYPSSLELLLAQLALVNVPNPVLCPHVGHQAIVVVELDAADLNNKTADYSSE